MKSGAVCKGLVIVAGFLMETGTVVAPLFFSVPRIIASNLVGTTFVAFALGPVYGCLFALGTNVLLNYATGGGSPIGYVLAVRAIEASVIGWVGRRGWGWGGPAVASLLNTAVMPPATFILAYFGGQVGMDLGFAEWFGREFSEFLRNGGLYTLQKYLFSCFVGYVLACGVKRFEEVRNVEPSV